MAMHVGVTAVIIMLIMPIIYCSLANTGGPPVGDLVGPTLTVSTARLSGTCQWNTEKK